MAEIPTSTTAAAIAKVLGISERIVASRKAAGRLPVLPGGAVDLAAVVRAGAAALAQQKPAGATSDLPPAERFDAGLRMAATTTAHLIVAMLAEAGPAADVGAVAAEALGEALELTGAGWGDVAPLARVEALPGLA